jgi:hypothetical protein
MLFRAILNGKLLTAASGRGVFAPPGAVHLVALDGCSVTVAAQGKQPEAIGLTAGGVFCCECDESIIFTFEQPLALNATESGFLEAALDRLSKADRKPHLHSIRNPAVQSAALLHSAAGVNVFESAGETCCVVKKTAKPRYHRRCPKVKARATVWETLRRASSGETPWKQCGATFSTMMRHFQKSTAAFSWKTDDEKQTTIRAHC